MVVVVVLLVPKYDDSEGSNSNSSFAEKGTVDINSFEAK